MDANKEPITTPEEVKKTPTEEARKAAADLRAATQEQKEENDRTERLKVNDALGGTTEAGQTPPVEKKENTPEEYADKVMRGDLNE